MAAKVRTCVKLEEMKEVIKREIGVTPPDDEVLAFWESASQRIVEQLSAKDYWLRNIRRYARRFVDAIGLKIPALLRSECEHFVTSDYPVVINHGLGLGDSDLYFPVGSHTALYFRARPEREMGPGIDIPLIRVGGEETRMMNKRAFCRPKGTSMLRSNEMAYAGSLTNPSRLSE